MPEPLDDAGLARLRQGMPHWPSGAVPVADVRALLARLDAVTAERDALRDSLRRTQEALQGMAARVAAQSELLSRRAEKEAPGD
jgi:hypothetical protein